MRADKMANTEAFLELATLAREAIDEAARLHKTASIDSVDINNIAGTLVDCGLLKKAEKEAFIKTASENPKTLVCAINWIAKKASGHTVVTTHEPVGTIVKDFESDKAIDHDQPYIDLYSNRNF